MPYALCIMVSQKGEDMARFDLRHKAIILGILLFVGVILLYACAETPQKRTLGGSPTGGKRVCKQRVPRLP